MNKSKLICVICRGFNKFFDAPKADGRTPVTFRTAIVIKKRDFYDEWDVYDALFWRIIQRITIDLNASIRIICPESETGEMQSLEELRTWQKKQAASDPEFGIDVPTEIRFMKGTSILCLMTLEDTVRLNHIPVRTLSRFIVMKKKLTSQLMVRLRHNYQMRKKLVKSEQHKNVLRPNGTGRFLL